MDVKVILINRDLRPSRRAIRTAISTSKPTSLSGSFGSASTKGAPPSGSPAQRSSRVCSEDPANSVVAEQATRKIATMRNVASPALVNLRLNNVTTPNSQNAPQKIPSFINAHWYDSIKSYRDIARQLLYQAHIGLQRNDLSDIPRKNTIAAHLGLGT